MTGALQASIRGDALTESVGLSRSMTAARSVLGGAGVLSAAGFRPHLTTLKLGQAMNTAILGAGLGKPSGQIAAEILGSGSFSAVQLLSPRVKSAIAESVGLSRSMTAARSVLGGAGVLSAAGFRPHLTTPKLGQAMNTAILGLNAISRQPGAQLHEPQLLEEVVEPIQDVAGCRSEEVPILVVSENGFAEVFSLVVALTWSSLCIAAWIDLQNAEGASLLWSRRFQYGTDFATIAASTEFAFQLTRSIFIRLFKG